MIWRDTGEKVQVTCYWPYRKDHRQSAPCAKGWLRKQCWRLKRVSGPFPNIFGRRSSFWCLSVDKSLSDIAQATSEWLFMWVGHLAICLRLGLSLWSKRRQPQSHFLCYSTVSPLLRCKFHLWISMDLLLSCARQLHLWKKWMVNSGLRIICPFLCSHEKCREDNSPQGFSIYMRNLNPFDEEITL